MALAVATHTVARIKPQPKPLEKKSAPPPAELIVRVRTLAALRALRLPKLLEDESVGLAVDLGLVVAGASMNSVSEVVEILVSFGNQLKAMKRVHEFVMVIGGCGRYLKTPEVAELRRAGLSVIRGEMTAERVREYERRYTSGVRFLNRHKKV